METNKNIINSSCLTSAGACDQTDKACGSAEGVHRLTKTAHDSTERVHGSEETTEDDCKNGKMREARPKIRKTRDDITFGDIRSLQELFMEFGIKEKDINMNELLVALPPLSSDEKDDRTDTRHWLTFQANKLFLVTLGQSEERKQLPLPEWVCGFPYCKNFDCRLDWAALVYIEKHEAIILAECGVVYRIDFVKEKDPWIWDQCARCADSSIGADISFNSVSYQKNEGIVTVTASNGKKITLNGETGEPNESRKARESNQPQKKKKIRKTVSKIRKQHNIR